MAKHILNMHDAIYFFIEPIGILMLKLCYIMRPINVLALLSLETMT